LKPSGLKWKGASKTEGAPIGGNNSQKSAGKKAVYQDVPLPMGNTLKKENPQQRLRKAVRVHYKPNRPDKKNRGQFLPRADGGQTKKENEYNREKNAKPK